MTDAEVRVDVVIGVHSPTRPIERAVDSVLANSEARALIVVHNTPRSGVEHRLGPLAGHDRVRIVELHDGVRSPAGAFNAGLDHSTAEFVSFLGSDDTTDPGAIDAWVAQADRDGADIVIAPVRRTAGGVGTMPRVRPRRTRNLDGDRDRLFEKTAPLGILRRSVVGELRYTVGIPRGVDQAFGIHLWFSGASISFDPMAPAYVEHDDQQDRVTYGRGPAIDDLRYVAAIESDDVFQAMPAAARRAVAAKIIRAHLLTTALSRLEPSGLAAQDRSDLVQLLAQLEGWAPGVRGLLARRDVALLDAILRDGADAETARRIGGDRGRFLSPGALLPDRLGWTLHRHAPLRSLAAGFLVLRRANLAHASRRG